MSDTILTLSHVQVGGSQGLILDDINLSLEAGHFMGIVGPNGAGKSTLLSVIVGLTRPSRGHVDLFGECLKKSNRRSLLKQIGYLNQFHTTGSHVPVRVSDVVAMGLPSYGAPLWRKSAHHKHIREALEKVGMARHMDTDYRELSGGQKQRVRIARTLAGQPRLLLLDEPSAGLDSEGQEKLYHLLRSLCTDDGLGIIMVEHDISAISSYVDSVACLNRHIHYHAIRGEHIPKWVWETMYGEHMHVIVHDETCIGCAPGTEK
jgi:zinc transport system ATP-binding protein